MPPGHTATRAQHPAEQTRPLLRSLRRSRAGSGSGGRRGCPGSSAARPYRDIPRQEPGSPREGDTRRDATWCCPGRLPAVRSAAPARCPGPGVAARGTRDTYLGCCRALTPRSGAHPRRSPPHALRGHGARRALRRRPLPHAPLPGVAGAAWGCPPHRAALPLHRLFNNLPPSPPRAGFFFFFPLESHGRGGQGKGESW